MAARFPQSTSSVAYQIKAAYSSKILAIYWAASADSVHRLYPGDTASTILTRATSGAGFNATEGRITGTVNGAGGVYFSDSKSGGIGTTEAGPLTYIASYFGDLFNGGANAWLFGNATPMDTFNDHTSAKVNSYGIDLVRKGASTLTLASGIGIADDVAAWVVLGYKYDPADGTAQHKLWSNGTELTAQRANGASGATATIGATATPFVFGGTVVGTGNTKLEGECWIVGKDISDADMAAITANPSIVIEVASGGGDTTSPTLTSPTGTATGTTTATVGATTNEANGTMYSIVSTSSTPPSVAQIQAGNQASGTAAPWSGNQAISSTGAKTFSATGLTASTTYYTHVQHKDAAGNDSTVVTSAGFTTSASDTTPPTLTSPTGSATGSTTGSGSVVTDEANGTLYFLATTNATETAATVKASGATQAISSTGTKSVSFTGLSASTTYYAHYVHRDAAGNDSTRVSSSSFTTSAGSTGTIIGDVIKNPSGAPMASTTIPKVVFKRVSDMVDVLSLTSQTTDSGGLLPITNAAIVTGIDYLRILCDATGANVGIKKFTAT